MSKASEWLKKDIEVDKTQPKFEKSNLEAVINSRGLFILKRGVDVNSIYVEHNELPEFLKWLKETFE